MSKGWRMSLLPITQHCGMAGHLGEKHGAGRSAAISSALHALCAKQPNATELMFRLTDGERAEVLKLKAPESFEIDGQTLHYEDAEKELEVVLTDGHGKHVSTGHLDMGWLVAAYGLKLAVVGDIKKTQFSATSSPGESLQMIAYGIAYARSNDCDGFVCGHWNATDGVWDWGGVIQLKEPGLGTLASGLFYTEMVFLAARNKSKEYAVGPHCSGCWSRMHCQEWLLPVSDPDSALAPFAKPGGITTDNAYEAQQLYARGKKLIAAMKSQLEAYGDRAGGIEDGEGKVWRRTYGRSPPRFDRKRFEVDHPGALDEYTYVHEKENKGFRWTKKK